MREGAIDTLTIAHRLRDAGFDKRQAEAVTFAIHDGLTGNLATKEDIATLRGEVKEDIARLEGKITQLYWMFSILVAGVASLVIEAFFV